MEVVLKKYRFVSPTEYKSSKNNSMKILIQPTFTIKPMKIQWKKFKGADVRQEFFGKKPQNLDASFLHLYCITWNSKIVKMKKINK